MADSDQNYKGEKEMSLATGGYTISLLCFVTVGMLQSQFSFRGRRPRNCKILRKLFLRFVSIVRMFPLRIVGYSVRNDLFLSSYEI